MASWIRSRAARLDGRFGAKPPSSPRPVDEALVLQHGLEGVVDLDAPAQALGEGLGAERGDHEFLDVDVGVGVRAAVEDVHQRNGQYVGVRAAQVLVQRQVGGGCGGVGNGQGDAEDGVGAELGLVGGAVQVDHGLVDAALVGGVEADQGRCDLVDDGVNGLLDTLAEVAALVAVAQLNGFVLAGGGTGRNGSAADLAVGERELQLLRWGCHGNRGSRGRGWHR